eukprot:2647181-Prymnesium_polylepis.1
MRHFWWPRFPTTAFIPPGDTRVPSYNLKSKPNHASIPQDPIQTVWPFLRTVVASQRSSSAACRCVAWPIYGLVVRRKARGLISSRPVPPT